MTPLSKPNIDKPFKNPRSIHAVKSSLIFGLELGFFWDELIMLVKIECIIQLELIGFFEILTTESSVFFWGGAYTICSTYSLRFLL
jgi:hypothetical protein